MTFQQYEEKYVTKERFDLIFGHLNGDLMWRKYRKAGSIEAFVRQNEDAQQRIAMDIRMLTTKKS